MSLVEITRNCFQSGVSPPKWLGLCKLFFEKEETKQSPESVQVALSNSVLLLFRSYPGDPDLQEYLKYAIQDGTLPVFVLVSTFLQAARSPDLSASSTLDMLCRTALDAHYSTGLPPLGSVVSFHDSPSVVLTIVQDGMALLRAAHALPMSHFHQVTTSASELLMLLLSCVSDLSQVSTAQALIHLADVNNILHTLNLPPDIRHALETFVVSLHRAIGDDTKATREAQMMQTLQLALGKGDGAESDSDIVTLGLELNHLVTRRASEFGSGNDANAVMLLAATFRWTSWTPTVFYTQLFLTAAMALSQSSFASPGLWRAFIVGRLPHILVSFEKAMSTDKTTDLDWRGATHSALATVLRRTDLITHCDVTLTRSDMVLSMRPDNLPRSFARDLLQQLISVGLVDERFAIGFDPMISNDSTPRIQAEASEAGGSLEAYIESMLGPEVPLDNSRAWLYRVWLDPCCHATFASIVLKRLIALTTSLDVEALSHLCKLLYSHDGCLDLIVLHVKALEVLSRTLRFVEEYDCETIGDPQTAVSHLGDVVLFLQLVLSRFHYEIDDLEVGESKTSIAYLKCTADVFSQDGLAGDDATAFISWYKALFDSSNEGIEDTILRSTRPRTILRLSATLFSHAIAMHGSGKIDTDTLNNGVSYFTGPLLSWTLVGVVQALLREIRQKEFNAPTHFEVLQMLLLSPTCPRPVISLCGGHVLTILFGKQGKVLFSSPQFDVASVQRVVTDVIGHAEAVQIQSTISLRMQLSWQQQPRRAIQEALAMAHSGKVPFLDVYHCLKIAPPTKFLQLLWSELVVTATLGEMENARRIGTFVLTMPTSTAHPPLLPIFVHVTVPSLIGAIDLQQRPEQTLSMELLATMLSSALTAALHVELALRSVPGEQRAILGQPSTAMARRLALYLRGRKSSHASCAIVQRLSSSQSFVANFPVFMGE